MPVERSANVISVELSTENVTKVVGLQTTVILGQCSKNTQGANPPALSADQVEH